MEIRVKMIKYVDKSGFTNINEVVIGVKPCKCIPLERIDYIHEGLEADYALSRKNRIVPSLVFPRMEVDIDYDYEENPYERYSEEYDYTEIKFCPKCGERIEVKVVEVSDVTDQILPIIDKVEELTNANNKRYSTKRCQEIFKLTQEYQKIMQIDMTHENILSPYVH